MIAQYLTQRRMQQVRGGVIQANACAARFINLRIQTIANAQMTGRELADMSDSLTIFLRVADAELGIHAFQHAGIADWPPDSP